VVREIGRDDDRKRRAERQELAFDRHATMRRMDKLIAMLGEYGLVLVFVNVLIEAVGMPVPAIPLLLVAGALAARGELPFVQLVVVAVATAMLVDFGWYTLGRRMGFRVLKTVCRVSLSPDSCVRQTEALFERLGMRSLLIAKFIPGYSIVAPPLAGATGAPVGQFLAYDGLGCLLWAGSAVTLGYAFRDAIGRVIAFLGALGTWALLLGGGALALLVAVKWWQRRRFYKVLRLARISIQELHDLIEDDDPPFIVDVRSARQHERSRIPGALRVTLEDIEEKLRELPRNREIVLYCT
jgi:membrane protein DedA with SNARE-associated domain